MRRFNEFSTKNGSSKAMGGGGYQKPRIPKLRRMSAAAFNFLSHNIAPKWLTDRLTDDGGGVTDKREWTDDPKHRLSLNDDNNYSYGSTYNGGLAVNDYKRRQSSQVHAPMAVPVPMPVASEPRHRRLSSPDPVLAHCANTIAVADFLMTLQRSLDKSSVTLQPSTRPGGYHVHHHERRSPLFTLFQDRRGSSSVGSWQYSSLASTTSTDTATTAAAVASAVQLPPGPGALTINAVITIYNLHNNLLIISPIMRKVALFSKRVYGSKHALIAVLKNILILLLKYFSFNVYRGVSSTYLPLYLNQWFSTWRAR